MGKGLLISPSLLSCFSHLIVFAKDLFCSLRVRCSERGKLRKGFAHLWELRQRNEVTIELICFLAAFTHQTLVCHLKIGLL